MPKSKSLALETTGYLALIVLFLAPYLTHLWWSLTTLFGAGDFGLREVVIIALGMLVPPLGWLHGLIIWLGAMA